MLENLQPTRVFYWFEQLCGIPHGSGDTKRISDFCMNFAAERGLAAVQDDLNNVIIYKDGSVGRESEPPVILQGHLDMVCEKEEDFAFDFATDPLQLYVEGDWVKARGTTLGGDDGIAVAMALAILEDNTLSHPPIEAVFTVDEETGMYGAEGLDGSRIRGRRLINIDSEAEGVITAGCAGGLRTDIELELIPTALTNPCYRIVLEGLVGGHSGVEIHTGRQNANKLLSDFLYSLKDVQLIELTGGSKDNVICPRAQALISAPGDVAALAAAFEKEHRSESDPDMHFTVTPVTGEVVGFDSISSRAALTMLYELPNGVQAWSPDIEGLVQTSLNFGTVKIEEDTLKLSFSLRSSLAAEKTALLSRLASVTEKHGATLYARGDYPAWEYRKDSPLRDKMTEIYTRMFGAAPKVEIIHAGLECGLLSEKLPGLDAVSIGPDMMDIHSPRERLSVASTERTYNYVIQILKEI